MTQSLLEKHTAYITRHIKSGGRVQTYLCPVCDGLITAPSPLDEEDVWDTLTVCPHCEEMHMQLVGHSRAKGLLPADD